jgi:hypothetical protein
MVFQLLHLICLEKFGEYNQPPRIVYTDHEFGAPFGKPHDDTTQLELLNECLNAFI